MTRTTKRVYPRKNFLGGQDAGVGGAGDKDSAKSRQREVWLQSVRVLGEVKSWVRISVLNRMEKKDGGWGADHETVSFKKRCPEGVQGGSRAQGRY